MVVVVVVVRGVFISQESTLEGAGWVYAKGPTCNWPGLTVSCWSRVAKPHLKPGISSALLEHGRTGGGLHRENGGS